jgi:hypothetical protein
MTLYDSSQFENLKLLVFEHLINFYEKKITIKLELD